MRDILDATFGILAAFLLYTLFRKVSLTLVETLNFFTLAVIYFALTKGEIFGALMGMVCGFVSDSFSLGVFGIAGIANTITGFLTGYISKKINFLSFLRSFVFIGLMAGLELVLLIFLSSLIFSETLNTERGLIFFQPITTGLLGSLLFLLMRKIKSKDGK